MGLALQWQRLMDGWAPRLGKRQGVAIIKQYRIWQAKSAVSNKVKEVLMKKGEALERFLNQEAREASENFVRNTLKYLEKETVPERKKEYIHNFQYMMDLCLKEQKEIRFFQIALVRSRALSGRPFYLLEAFQEDLYLSEPAAYLEMDLWWLYRGYWQFCEEIDHNARRYPLCFDAKILDRIKLAELANCRRFVRYLFEETITAIMNTEEYQKLSPKEGFQIHLGEYRGPYEIIFQTNPYVERLGRWWHGILQAHAKEKY